MFQTAVCEDFKLRKLWFARNVSCLLDDTGKELAEDDLGKCRFPLSPPEFESAPEDSTAIHTQTD